MRNKGRLIALDVHARKLQELQRRARRAGLSNLQTMLLQDDWPPQLRRFSGKADRVLVDVPCSGLGAFRRKPEMRWRLSAEDLERLPREQEAIARRAMQLLAPGGRLIYATCTILREENESVIERLLGDAQFERVPAKEVLGKEKASHICDSSGMFLQLLPHQHGCDGFFAAILRRKR
jgi:16S rRNA (cytosine967-C5)-methyltransferase